MLISGLFQGLNNIAMSKRLYVIIGFIVLWIVFGASNLAFSFELSKSIVVVSFLVTGLISALIVYSVIISLKNGLSNVVNRGRLIEEGDVNTRLDVDLKNEIGLLATTFNNLADQLAQNVNEVESLSSSINKERESAEHYEKAKEYFLVNMSHEIRTPMNAILGFANYLQGSLKEEDEVEAVKMIVKSGEHLLSTLNDILDFVSIQTGEISFSCAPFNLKDVVHSVFMLNEPNAKLKGIGLNYNIGEHLPDVIYGDQDRLTQVLLNLTSNAIKFTEMGGVLISARSISDHDDHVMVEFSVHDTGIGIDDEMQQKIFSPFEQGDNNMQRKFGGTGIGLSIVKYLIDLQDGVLQLKSQPGEGSEFSFRLRFHKPHAEKNLDRPVESEGDAIQESEVGKGIHVLIVEDNMMNRELVIKLLERKGYQTSIAENGEIALDIYEKEDFDIILMDLQMPEMDGYETTRQIRGMTSSKKDIPIVAMTAHAVKGEQEKCFSIGMNDFISKPFQAQELYNKVRTLVAASKVM